jgi:hypothetical protein
MGDTVAYDANLRRTVCEACADEEEQGAARSKQMSLLKGQHLWN